MNDRDRALLTEMRRLLLQLHKTLIDWQREDYEGQYGRLQTPQLLQVLFDHPEFAWLRTMSGLIVSIDEALDVKSPEVSETGPLVAKARELIAPEAVMRCVITPRCRSCPKRCWPIATWCSC